MTTLELITAIISRLKIWLARLDIREWPDNPSDFVLTHPKGALLVMYADSSGDNQQRVKSVEVTVIARSCRNATMYLEAVRLILSGWRAFEGASAFVCISDEFLKEDAGEWHYAVKFNLPGPPLICDETDLPTRLAELGL